MKAILLVVAVLATSVLASSLPPGFEYVGCGDDVQASGGPLNPVEVTYRFSQQGTFVPAVDSINFFDTGPSEPDLHNYFWQPAYVPNPANGWKQGVLPFGENVFCPLLAPFTNGQVVQCATCEIGAFAGATEFPRWHDLYVRQVINMPANAAYDAFGDYATELKIVKDNNLLGVWVNGVQIPQSEISSGGCPGVSAEFTFPIKLRAGDNVIAMIAQDISGEDKGNQTWLNYRIIGPLRLNDGSDASNDGNCQCIQPIAKTN